MSDWYSGGRRFSLPDRPHSFVEIGHEIISTAIVFLPLIQVGQFSVTGDSLLVIEISQFSILIN